MFVLRASLDVLNLCAVPFTIPALGWATVGEFVDRRRCNEGCFWMSVSAVNRKITLNDVLREAVAGMFIIDRNRQVALFSEGCERIAETNRASVLIASG